MGGRGAHVSHVSEIFRFRTAVPLHYGSACAVDDVIFFATEDKSFFALDAKNDVWIPLSLPHSSPGEDWQMGSVPRGAGWGLGGRELFIRSVAIGSAKHSFFLFHSSQIHLLLLGADSGYGSRGGRASVALCHLRVSLGVSEISTEN